jgi:acetylornithine deacetylase/succinyl-diaminopimelate desuccinylase-like protein
VKGLDVDVEAYQYSEVSSSPSNTPFYDAIQSTVTEMSPEFVAVPQISAGASDSRFWRGLGSVVYGCVPLSYEAKIGEVSRGVHSANERVDTGSLSLGATFLGKLIQRTIG